MPESSHKTYILSGSNFTKTESSCCISPISPFVISSSLLAKAPKNKYFVETDNDFSYASEFIVHKNKSRTNNDVADVFRKKKD